jgi:hypothetical protein
MIEDELFKHAQTFPMSEDATNQMLETLRNLETSNAISRKRRQRWLGSSVAAAAAVAVVACIILFVIYAPKSKPTDTVAHKAPISKPVQPTSIKTRSDGAVEYDYTGPSFQPAVRKYENFPVIAPKFHSGTTVTDHTYIRFPANKNKTYPMPSLLFQRVEFDASLANEETFIVQEWTDKVKEANPFDALTGPGEIPSLGKPQTIRTDGVDVRVGWPQSNEAHMYEFTRNGILYFVKVNWPNNNAPVASKDTIGWNIVRSLISGKPIS